MARQDQEPGVWLIRKMGWIAVGAGAGFGALMLLFEWPVLLALLLAVAVTMLAWFGGKAWRSPALQPTAGAGTVGGAGGQQVPPPAGLPPDLIEVFPLPLVVTRSNEIVLASSQAARRLFPALAIGRPISLALRNPDLLDALIATRQDGIARTIILDDGTALAQVMRAHVVAMMQSVSMEPSVMVVFEDLTEQRATERMRVDFIANASHELRTPLASLLGFIETLQGPARDDAKARERFLAIMREQAGRMARLIEDLLSLSRAELRAHQQPVNLIDLRAIVREIADSLSLSASERGVALKLDLPREPLNIRGDRDDLLRLVENLVENAIRYGANGERVYITTTLNDRGETVLSIRDFGPGIEAQHIPRLTERFYRADVSHSRENGGTGLGLAIVKHLVARHRARLEIESKPGEGATFRVVFSANDRPGE